MKIKIYMRSFAPWSSFGGIFPGPDYVQVTSRLTEINDSNYDGDGRTFSLRTDDPRITSRIRFEGNLNVDTWEFASSKVESDPSRGPMMLIGPIRTGTARPKAEIYQWPTKTGTELDVWISGANPLIPGAPDIDAGCEYSFSRTKDMPVGAFAIGGFLEIQTRISGDQFPAFETFVDDDQGGKVFLGGFAPESRSPAQLARLFGQLNKPREVWFESKVRIYVQPGERFGDVEGSWSSSAQRAQTTAARMPAVSWNKMLTEQFPMPIDGWVYGAKAGDRGQP